jgi:hypothetical protein|nr:MAG TPA: hypothetical protein [Caudoviricetes sp.]
MAVKTREEILESLRGRFGEEPTDDDIAMLEDITDTFTDFEEKTSDATNWKNKYEENDKAWKKKYSDRFFSKDGGQNSIHYESVEPDDEPVKSFNDLFTVKE